MQKISLFLGGLLSPNFPKEKEKHQILHQVLICSKQKKKEEYFFLYKNHILFIEKIWVNCLGDNQ
jgi:hypothetical protein